MSASRKVIPLLPVPNQGGIEPAVRIHARAVSGLFSRWRWSIVWLTQLLFYGLPWLQWGGRQAVLFDLEARRFYVFGAVLFPQDLIYLTGLLVFSALLLFFATAIAGRVWCGFACPQTVYTEIFMWIEQRFEGDRLARLRLDAKGWGAEKLLRRGGKHAAWIGLSLLTGFSLVGWFTPIREFGASLPALAFGPWEAFWTLFYGAATYLHAGLLREKVCQHACPYGRFQGSMLDPATLVVSYDEARGEPRGARSRGSDAKALAQGDCVDCTLCVQVCPVGIDIRQGLQAACISCGLCIDACNQVMDKLRAPRGLIGFSALRGRSAAAAPGPWSAWLRPRVLVYGCSLMLLGATLAWAWFERPELRMNVLRDRSVLSRMGEDGAVENVYRLQMMNASLRARQLSLHASTTGAAPLALQVAYRGDLSIESAGASSTVVTVRMAEADAHRLSSGKPVPIRFELRDAQGESVEMVQADSTFILR